MAKKETPFATMSNADLIQMLSTNESDHVKELVKRYEQALDGLSFPNRYYKKDVDDFVSGKTFDLQKR